DAMAIVVYRMAVAAAVTGAFSLVTAGGRFLWAASAGVGVGLAVGWAIAWLRRRIHAPEAEATISLLTPFAAFFPAERIEGSGVLAVLTAGLYLAWRGPRILKPDSRVLTTAMWDLVGFLLEGLTFVFIGLELRNTLGALRGYPVSELVWASVAVSVATIAARVVWVFGCRLIPWRHRRGKGTDPLPSWRQVLLIAWAALRGADSLVLALALPLATATGAPFPGRDLIIFLTYVVILFTLIGQGFSMRPIANWLGICETGEVQKLEEAHARQEAADAALKRLDE